MAAAREHADALELRQSVAGRRVLLVTFGPRVRQVRPQRVRDGERQTPGGFRASGLARDRRPTPHGARHHPGRDRGDPHMDRLRRPGLVQSEKTGHHPPARQGPVARRGRGRRRLCRGGSGRRRRAGRARPRRHRQRRRRGFEAEARPRSAFDGVAGKWRDAAVRRSSRVVPVPNDA